MKKLLVAVSSEVLLQALMEELWQDYCVIPCTDGETAHVLLQKEDPEFAILDLMLPGMDGVGLLQTARIAGVKTRVIAVSYYISDYLVQSLEQLQVSYFIRLPCRSQILAERLRDMDRHYEGETGWTRAAQELLAVLGFRVNSVGYRTVLTALEIFRKDPNQKITKQLYPAVAQICGGTGIQVEKAIRSAIESAWMCRNEEIWRCYFSLGQNGKVVRPTNADFLARVLLYTQSRLPDAASWEKNSAV